MRVENSFMLKTARLKFTQLIHSESLGGVVLAVAAVLALLISNSPLAGWYSTHGFEVSGPEFLEDGIPHLPMRRKKDR